MRSKIGLICLGAVITLLVGFYDVGLGLILFTGLLFRAIWLIGHELSHGGDPPNQEGPRDG